MTHPNCRPSPDMISVSAAAERAARRITSWDKLSAKTVHGLNGHRDRKVRKFTAFYGGHLYTFYLTSSGVILQYTSSKTNEIWPVILADCKPDKRSAIEESLNNFIVD